jgi:NADPH:quinone reductase-like Zn-dependent oxidoreductase
MKAIRFDRYGSPDVLELRDVPKPEVGPHDVLVRVRAASANPYDWHFLTGLPHIGRPSLGLFKPKVSGMGADLAGEVVAVGSAVTQFFPGDEVFGEVDGEVPGMGHLDLGSFAEYVCVKEGSVAPKPINMSFEEAAAAPMAGLTALQGIRDRGKVQPGQKVLINGASGGVGTFAVQIAKALGAQVTGVCSTRNVEMVLSIGADHVVDYTKDDFTRGQERYDLILDNVGSKKLSQVRRVMKPKGMYLSSFGSPENPWLGPIGALLKMTVVSPFVSQTTIGLTIKRKKEDLLALKELMEAGKVKPVIDRSYPLAEAAEAMRYLEKGHARGKVVVVV